MGAIFANEVKARPETMLNPARPKQEAGIGRQLYNSARKGQAHKTLFTMASNMRKNIFG